MVTQFYPTLPVSSTEPSSSSLNAIDPIAHSISAIMSSHIAEASNSILSKTFEESEFFRPSIVISTSIILSENKSSLSSNEIISSPSSAFHQMNSTSLEVLDSSKDQLSTLFGVSSILLAAMTNSSEMFYTTSLNPASSQTQSKNWLSSKSYNFPSSVLVSNKTSEATELTSLVEDHVTSYSMMQTHSSQAVLEYSTSFIAQNSPIHSLKDVSSKEVTTSNILSPIFSEDGEGSMYTSMSSKVYPSRTSTDLQQSKVSQFNSSIEFVESSSNSTLQPSSHVAILSSSNVIRTEPLTTTLPLSTTFLSPSVTGVQSSSTFTRSSVDSQSVVLSSGVINQQNTDKVVYVSSSISSFSTDFLPETETSKSSGYSTDLMPLTPSDDTSTEMKISTNIEIKPSSEFFSSMSTSAPLDSRIDSHAQSLSRSEITSRISDFSIVTHPPLKSTIISSSKSDFELESQQVSISKENFLSSLQDISTTKSSLTLNFARSTSVLFSVSEESKLSPISAFDTDEIESTLSKVQHKTSFVTDLFEPSSSVQTQSTHILGTSYFSSHREQYTLSVRDEISTMVSSLYFPDSSVLSSIEPPTDQTSTKIIPSRSSIIETRPSLNVSEIVFSSTMKLTLNSPSLTTDDFKTEEIGSKTATTEVQSTAGSILLTPEVLDSTASLDILDSSYLRSFSSMKSSILQPKESTSIMSSKRMEETYRESSSFTYVLQSVMTSSPSSFVVPSDSMYSSAESNGFVSDYPLKVSLSSEDILSSSSQYDKSVTHSPGFVDTTTLFSDILGSVSTSFSVKDVQSFATTSTADGTELSSMTQSTFISSKRSSDISEHFISPSHISTTDFQSETSSMLSKTISSMTKESQLLSSYTQISDVTTVLSSNTEPSILASVTSAGYVFRSASLLLTTSLPPTVSATSSEIELHLSSLTSSEVSSMKSTDSITETKMFSLTRSRLSSDFTGVFVFLLNSSAQFCFCVVVVLVFFNQILIFIYKYSFINMFKFMLSLLHFQ